MSNHEEGEIEFVLGNKQLLSVFFLVVLLLGVFFSMGYIVGRNTAPTSSLTAANRPPVVVDSTRGSDINKPSALTPKVEPPKVEPPPVSTAPIETAKPPKVEPPPPTPAVKPLAVTPPPPKVEPVKPPKPEPVKPPPATVTRGSGTFLQVVATKRPDAEKVVASLGSKGFPASMMPVPDSTLVRVVVGPLVDDSVSRTRSGLEAAGYKPIVRKF